jgi:hypothetical protein
MAQGFQTLTNWTIGGGQPAPPPKSHYHEATLRRGYPRRGRVITEESDTLLVAFYATGEEEIVKKEDVTLTVRRP